jgi:hypothetical protein
LGADLLASGVPRPKICGVVAGDRSRHRIPREEALPLTVGEVMIARPKTFRSDVKVGAVRLVVLDEDGHTLRGLLCFNQSSASFCVR